MQANYLNYNRLRAVARRPSEATLIWRRQRAVALS
jgi:hypothetical protein